MKCSNCENKKDMKKDVITYKYKDCGLDNITLSGVTLLRCEHCGEEYYNFGDIESLHQTIADMLLQKSDLLTGKEIKFLRKHIGYSGAMFSYLVGYAHETLYRIESGAQSVTVSFDRLIRFSVASKFPDRDYKLHDMILKKCGRSISRIELMQISDGSWKIKDAA